jgi:hypothetical protein
MRRYGWILIIICLTGLQLYVMFAPTGPMNFDNHPFLLPAILVLYAAPALGGWWMIFMIIRYEKRVFPLILVPFLIPNAFVWYYFARTRSKRRVDHALNSEPHREP